MIARLERAAILVLPVNAMPAPIVIANVMHIRGMDVQKCYIIW